MRDNDFLPIDTLRLNDLGGNIYRSIIVAGKRANQLTLEVKDELPLIKLAGLLHLVAVLLTFS